MKATFILLALATVISVSHAATDKLLCYYGSWAVYRQGNGKFDVEDIPTDLCTHAIFTFCGLNADGTIHILDPWNEIDKKAIARFADLRKLNANLKVIMAIGGWNEGSATYSSVVNNAALRATFVKSIVNFVKEYNYDGFDLDWEYPAKRGGNPEDRVGYIELLKELRPHFDENGWLLTAAVHSMQDDYHWTSYNVPEMNKYLDLISVMTYDLHGIWDSEIGHNSPLYPSSKDVNKKLCVDAAIKGWIESGADREKLIVGLATYGRTFALQNANQHEIGDPHAGGGNAGPYTQTMGYLGYLEICELQKQGGWTTEWSDEQLVPYTYKGNQWYGYDNVESLKIKTQYAKEMELAGVMIWSIETDDARNVCGGGRFPLCQAIIDVIGGEIPPIVTTPPPETTTGDGSSTESTTQSTTARPTPPPNDICKKEGYVRDEHDCSVFYLCVNMGDKWEVVPYKCGDGLYFDLNTSTCDWPSNVDCTPS